MTCWTVTTKTGLWNFISLSGEELKWWMNTSLKYSPVRNQTSIFQCCLGAENGVFTCEWVFFTSKAVTKYSNLIVQSSCKKYRQAIVWTNNWLWGQKSSTAAAVCTESAESERSSWNKRIIHGQLRGNDGRVSLTRQQREWFFTPNKPHLEIFWIVVSRWQIVECWDKVKCEVQLTKQFPHKLHEVSLQIIHFITFNELNVIAQREAHLWSRTLIYLFDVYVHLLKDMLMIIYSR